MNFALRPGNTVAAGKKDYMNATSYANLAHRGEVIMIL